MSDATNVWLTAWLRPLHERRNQRLVDSLVAALQMNWHSVLFLLTGLQGVSWNEVEGQSACQRGSAPVSLRPCGSEFFRFVTLYTCLFLI